MSDIELVKRLQVGHDPHCAMSYGMHEHCCDCSYPCRQEAVETINKLRQDLAAARAERDAAFKMSKCECGADECCANLVRLHDDLAAARDTITKMEAGYARAATMIISLKADLAAARADAARYRWLRSNPTYLGWEHDCPPEFIDSNIDAAIDAALAGEKNDGL